MNHDTLQQSTRMTVRAGSLFNPTKTTNGIIVINLSTYMTNTAIMNTTPVPDFNIAMTRHDIREAAKTLTDTEARFLVDAYYIAQGDRIRHNNQERAMAKDNEPTLILSHLGNQAQIREDFIKKVLDDYTINSGVGAWLRTIHGIGPVTAAGLLAHIDIRRAATAGAVWRFAGLNPDQQWNKGEKRPWNATLKVLAFKIGESFVKTSNSDKSYYGKLYRKRKDFETRKNMSGGYAHIAAEELRTKNYKTTTVTYKRLIEGKLSDAHIHARARRWAVKIFLSHLHEIMYRVILGVSPPLPFAIAILDHAHILVPPNAGSVPTFVDPLSDTDEIRLIRIDPDEYIDPDSYNQGND